MEQLVSQHDGMKCIQHQLDQHGCAMDLRRREPVPAATIESVQSLLRQGADPSLLSVNMGDGDMTSTVILAAGKGWVNLIELFLQIPRLDLNVVDADGENALIASLAWGNGLCARLLLDHTDLGALSNTHESALTACAKCKDLAIASDIISRLTPSQMADEAARLDHIRTAGTSSAEMIDAISGRLFARQESMALDSFCEKKNFENSRPRFL